MSYDLVINQIAFGNPSWTQRECELYHRMLSACRVPSAAFRAVLLPGYRIMGMEWAEAVIRAWSEELT